MPSLAITPDQVRGRLWAKRLKRVFNIDIETCDKCGGDVRIIARIEDPAVIRTLLAYLNKKWVMAGGSDFYAKTSAWSQHRWVKRQIPAFNRQIAQPFAESQANYG